MVVEWFLNWSMGVVQWLLDLLPDWDVPAEMLGAGGLLDSILANASGLGVWIDWTTNGILIAIPFAVWTIGILWKALRTAFSHFPGIGGSG